ncbi:MAG: sulfurtransferase [Spirochaetes bacterium]|nr:sulfurtransferase [Spirochaetota bacterium]
MVDQITVYDLKAKIDSGAQFVLVDVRGQNELDICRFENARHIPLHLLTVRHTELNPTDEIVVACHHGSRSQQAAFFLVEQGYRNVANLRGGIDAWAEQIDPEMARY